jgi:N-acetylmuramoyl-L-alanine amidase
LRDEAAKNLMERRAQLKKHNNTDKPRIITAKQAGLSPASVFGQLGPERKATPHYAASPRARNLAEGIKLSLGFDRFHRGKGWGGLSYHYCIPDTGEIICGRSTMHKGAHVANMNAGNIGINFFCTTGHEPTEAQKKSAQWLIANAHTSAMPKLHRTDLDLRKADIRGHNQWPGQSTGCPGNFTPKNLGV